MRTFALASLLAAAAFAGSTQFASAQSSTTRIEPRPFYGATVTIEEGVRVFRPLPPTRHVIVNPNGRTPLALSFNETKVVEHSINHNYHYTDGSGAPVYGVGGYPLYYGNAHHHPRHVGGRPGRLSHRAAHRGHR